MNDPEGGRLRGLLRNPAAQHAGAILLYLAIWLVAVGPKILPHMSSWTLSSYPNEPSVFVWSLEWWAHPFSHGANPLLSSTVWAPTGLNLAWVATSPAPGLVAAPITIPFGPVVSFNVLSLVTPPLTAWTTYLLARHVTRVFPAALVGGYLFGFSPVVMREIELGHLNLSMLFLLPLAAYLVVRRLDGTIGPRAFVALLTALLVFEFGIFTEILATMTLVGLVVGAVAWLLASADLRRRLAGAAVLVAVSFAVAAALISPYLYTAFAHPQAVKPATFEGLAVGAKSTSDLTRYVLPRPGFAIGPGVRHRPDLNWWYFGVPLLLLLVLFWMEGWRTFAARLLGLGFLISLVLSIGSKLPGGGIPFPWAALEKLPLLDRARPGRIIAYAFLFAAISAAVWAAKGRTKTVGSVLRWLLVAAVDEPVPGRAVPRRDRDGRRQVRRRSALLAGGNRDVLPHGHLVLGLSAGELRGAEDGVPVGRGTGQAERPAGDPQVHLEPPSLGDPPAGRSRPRGRPARLDARRHSASDRRNDAAPGGKLRFVRRGVTMK